MKKSDIEVGKTYAMGRVSSLNDHRSGAVLSDGSGGWGSVSKATVTGITSHPKQRWEGAHTSVQVTLPGGAARNFDAREVWMPWDQFEAERQANRDRRDQRAVDQRAAQVKRFRASRRASEVLHAMGETKYSHNVYDRDVEVAKEVGYELLPDPDRPDRFVVFDVLRPGASPTQHQVDVMVDLLIEQGVGA